MNKQLEQLKNIIMKYYKKERKEVFLKQLEKNFILKYKFRELYNIADLKNMTKEEIIAKNKLFNANFKGDKDSLLFAKRSVDNLIKRRFMAIEQLNRNLGNQGARFKTVLDAVEFVKNDLENSDMDDPKNQERIALNLKRIYQSMALITSETREEISLISKNVINNQRTNEIEKLMLDMIEEELILSDNEVVVKHSEMPINKRMNTELAEVRKTKNISDYLTKKYQ